MKRKIPGTPGDGKEFAVDDKCFQLATDFLPNDATEYRRYEVAQAIQDAIEEELTPQEISGDSPVDAPECLADVTGLDYDLMAKDMPSADGDR